MHFRLAQASCPVGQMGSSVESRGLGVLASAFSRLDQGNQVNSTLLTMRLVTVVNLGLEVTNLAIDIEPKT